MLAKEKKVSIHFVSKGVCSQTAQLSLNVRFFYIVMLIDRSVNLYSNQGLS